MDFHSLSRKDLQTLCKKNKIPANLTNVAMADALTSLHQVEGVDEFMDALESDPQKSPERVAPACPDIPKTVARTTTRRKQVDMEPRSAVTTRRTTRRSTVEEADQESKNVSQLATPAEILTRTRRMATAAASVRQRSVAGEEKSVQRGPATRQSVRLLEKSLREMTLGKIEPVKIGDYGSGKETEEILSKIGTLEDHLSHNQTVDNENVEAKVPEDNKGNEFESEYCSVKLDFDGDVDLGNSDSYVEDEVADKKIVTVDGNTEKSINDDGSGKISEEIANKIGILEVHLSQSQTTNNKNVEAEVPEDSKENDYESKNCSVKLDSDGDNVLGSTGSPVKDEVDDENIVSLDGNTEKSINDNCNMFAEEDTSAGENNDEILNDSLISEIVCDVTSNNDSAACSIEVKNDEIATSLDEEFCSTIEIQEPLVQGLVGDNSENNSMQDEQHDNLDVGSKFSIVKESDCKALEIFSENKTRAIVQEQVSQPSESGPVQNLDSRSEFGDSAGHYGYEGCHLVSKNLESSSDFDAIKRLNESCDKAESEDTHVVNVDKVPEDNNSETSVSFQETPAEKVLVTSDFKYPSTLNNPNSNVTGTIPISVFDTPKAQFPRPTGLTPTKCPTKKDTTQATVNQPSDSEEDNIHYRGNNLEPKKEEITIMVDKDIQYENCSLRQLTKMVKQLQISQKKKEEKNANKTATRHPLQSLPGNGILETEKGKQFY